MPTPSKTQSPAPSLPTPPSPVSRVADLLTRMTLEQKVGQLMVIGFDGTTLTPELRDMLERYHVGGVILYDRNIESPQQLAQLNNAAQQAAQQSGHVGLFVSIDQEGGIVTRLKTDKGFTEFPGAMALAATGDAANVRRVAQTMALEMRAVGINADFAPDLDVNNNPANPVIGSRSFGSDPQRVAQFGVAFVAGLQSAGVLAFGKHFPGHGDTSVDSHVALPSVPHERARLDAVEFVPFRAAMQAGVAGIMSAHLTFPAIDPTPALAATLSPKVLTDLLRGELQYDGLLVTDSLMMGALAQSGYPPPQAAATSLKAGADILLFNSGYELHRQAHRLMVDWVQRGVIPQARLDEAVRRVLLAKARYAILDAPSVDASAASSRVGTPENQSLSRNVAAQSVTLLRDDAHWLPLASDAKLFVVETASNLGLGKALGATTMTLSAPLRASDITTIVERGKEGRTIIVASSDAAKNPAQASLINALLSAKVRTVVVAMRSPYDLMAFASAPTYLTTYGSQPSSVEALVDVLMGKANAQGRLPVELPGLYKIGDGM